MRADPSFLSNDSERSGADFRLPEIGEMSGPRSTRPHMALDADADADATALLTNFQRTRATSGPDKVKFSCFFDDVM
jgi:hypothetical protein